MAIALDSTAPHCWQKEPFKHKEDYVMDCPPQNSSLPTIVHELQTFQNGVQDSMHSHLHELAYCIS